MYFGRKHTDYEESASNEHVPSPIIWLSSVSLHHCIITSLFYTQVIQLSPFLHYLIN